MWIAPRLDSPTANNMRWGFSFIPLRVMSYAIDIASLQPNFSNYFCISDCRVWLKLIIRELSDCSYLGWQIIRPISNQINMIHPSNQRGMAARRMRILLLKKTRQQKNYVLYWQEF